MTEFARQAVGAMVAMKSVIVTTVLSVILNQESVYAPQDGKVFPVKTNVQMRLMVRAASTNVSATTTPPVITCQVSVSAPLGGGVDSVIRVVQ